MDWINLSSNEQLVNFSTNFGTCKVSKECISGGFFKDKKEYAWLMDSSTLKIVSTKNGHVIFSSPVFQSVEFETRLETSHLFKVSEYGRFLALVFRITDGNVHYSIVVIYSLNQNRIINFIKICMEVVSISYLPRFICSDIVIKEFDGILVLGTQTGELLLLDLQIQKSLDRMENMFTILENPSNCSMCKYNLPSMELRKLFQHNSKTSDHFAVKIKIIKTAITSLFCIDKAKILALGSIMGDLILFDLETMRVFHSYSGVESALEAPLINIEYIEPADDPCPCFYLWAIFKNDKLVLKLYSVMFDKQYHEEILTFSQAFRKCSLRFELALEDSDIKFFSSQTVYSTCTLKEEFVSSLFSFSWFSLYENKNKLLLFDLNQWYKEEMPNEISLEHKPRYISLFHLNEKQMGLQASIEDSSLAHYNSIYRSEEHFYPNSLSFDCLLLLPNSCKTFYWLGLQNKIINKIKSSNFSIFVHAESYVKDIIEAGLVPQFVDLNAEERCNQKYALEVILSFALENSCYYLLRDCINSCLHSTISGFNVVFMDWIWTRVSLIESRCKLLCTGLFDARRSFVDLDTFQELDHLSKQLTFLSTLISEIFQESKYKDDNIQRLRKLRIHSSFYNILVWMLNNNLLIKTECRHDRQILRLIKYSSNILEEKYKNRRMEILKSINLNRCDYLRMNELMFIDLLIERKFKSKNDQCRSEKLPFDRYPPKSLQEILNMFMVESTNLKNKFTLFLYFLIDLIKISEGVDLGVMEKFATSFNIPDSLVTRALCFWNFDRGFLNEAVNFFICMKSKVLSHPKWCIDLMMEVLLAQNQPKLAIRVLNTVPSLVSNKLKTEIFLWNGLFNDAFQIVRAKDNSNELLLLFYNFLLKHSRYDIIYQLGLNHRETTLLHSLTSREPTQIESLHLGYILQKLNLIDVLRFEEENSKKKLIPQRNNISELTENVVLSAFKSTIPPVSQNITEFYCSQKNKLKSRPLFEDITSPLSSQLVKENLLQDNFLYHSAVSSHFASNCCDNFHNDVLSTSNTLAFIRKPQDYMKCNGIPLREQISFPQLYKSPAKRSLNETRDLSPENPKPKRQKTSKDDDNLIEESFLSLCNKSIQQNINTLGERDTLHGILKVKDYPWTVNESDTEKNLRFDSFYKNESEISATSIEFEIGDNHVLTADSLKINHGSFNKHDENEICKDAESERSYNHNDFPPVSSTKEYITVDKLECKVGSTIVLNSPEASSDVVSNSTQSVTTLSVVNTISALHTSDKLDKNIRVNCYQNVVSSDMNKFVSREDANEESCNNEVRELLKSDQRSQTQERNVRSVSVPANKKDIALRSETLKDESGPRRKTRAGSVPPKTKIEKPTKSNSMEHLPLDSPASRTRSRTRLNSIDSDIDSPINNNDKKGRSLIDIKASPKRLPLCTRRRSLHSTPENVKSEGDDSSLSERYSDAKNSDLKRLTRNQVRRQSKSENYESYSLRKTPQHFLEAIPEAEQSDTPTKGRRRSQAKK